MFIADLLSGLSILTAAIYGFAFLTQPVTPLRAIIKTLAVASIAGVSLVLHGPWLLTSALALSAVGDAFLAGEPKKWLPFGLAAFLAAHLLYIGLFATSGTGLATMAGQPLRLFPALVTVVLAGAMLAWLWPVLGKMRWPVVGYVAVITAMTVFAFALPWPRSAAMIGAVLFFASDAILAVRLFRSGGPSLQAHLAVWWFYWAAQALIARAFLHHIA